MLDRIVMFLLGAVANFFTFMFLARLLMQAFRVSFANQFGEMVVALTNWAVRPLRRIVPGLFGLDLASLLPAWLLQVLVFVIGVLLRGGDWFFGNLGAVVPAALAVGAIDTLVVAIYVLMLALIAAAVMSWVNPYSPMAMPMVQLTRPLLRPIQRVLPPLSNIDLSPLVAILLLQVVLMVLEGFRSGLPRLFFG